MINTQVISYNILYIRERCDSACGRKWLDTLLLGRQAEPVDESKGLGKF